MQEFPLTTFEDLESKSSDMSIMCKEESYTLLGVALKKYEVGSKRNDPCSGVPEN